ELVLGRIDQLDIANRAGGARDLSRDTLVALGAEARRPADAGPGARPALPLGADGAEVIDEDLGGAATVGAVHRGDGLLGELDLGVLPGNQGIVPVLDLAEEDPRGGLGGDLEPARDALEVVRQDDSAE